MIFRGNIKKLISFILALLVISIFVIYNKVDNIDEKSNIDARIEKINTKIKDLRNKLPKNHAIFEANIVQRPSVFKNSSKDSTFLLKKRQSDYEMTNLYEKIKYLDLDGGVWKQGWKYEAKKPEGKPLIVIVTPHSHQDPGWIYTFEEYFTRQTKISLDKTIDFLKYHPDAKFIYAEISFFSLWWSSASEDQRNTVKRLLDNNQLEFVTGGWVMNDEANTHAYAMVDQLTEGHHWLLENLNYRPRSGWQIDPFGHSNTMGFLAKKTNLTHILIQRTHYEVKKALAQEKSLEFNWVQSWDRSGNSSVFCHMMPFYSYDVPHTCGPDPSVCCQFDFIRTSHFGCPWGISPVIITDQNVKQRSEMLVNQYHLKAMLYQSHNVLFVPLGDDFRYRFNNEWNLQYDNYKRIMDYVNSNREIYNTEIKFGTLSDYFDLVEQRIKEGKNSEWSGNLPTLQGDMFSYADRVKDYWSGYYTSRPLHKRLTRIVEAQVRAADILYSMANLRSSLNMNDTGLFNSLTLARRNLGLFQHHDGITGTEKPDVAKDYEAKLEKALDSANLVQKRATEMLFLDQISVSMINNIWNDLVHSEKNFLSIADLSKAVEISLFNPNLIWPKSETIKIRINSTQSLEGITPEFKLKDDLTRIVPMQVDLLNPNNMDLTFNIDYANVKGLSFKTGILSFSKDATNDSIFSKTSEAGEKLSMRNNRLELIFNKNTGLLESILNLATGTEKSVQISLEYFQSSKSGAYLFMPDSETTNKYQWRSPKIVKKQGPIYDEITVSDAKITHRVVLPKSSHSDDFEIINSVHLDEEFSSSIDMVMRVSTQIKNSREIYTDSNCYQLLRRPYIEKIPIQGNVYPMPCSSFIQSTESKEESVERMTMITSHPIGVSSPVEGTVLVWLDRKSFQDDNRGLFIGIMDNSRVSNKIKVIFESVQQEYVRNDLIPSHSKSVLQAIEGHLNPLLVFSSVCKTLTECLTPDHELIRSQAAKLDSSYKLMNLKTFHSTADAFKTFNSKSNTQVGFVIQRTYSFDNAENNKTLINLKMITGENSRAIGFAEATLTLIPDSSKEVKLFGRESHVQLEYFDIQGYLFKF